MKGKVTLMVPFLISRKTPPGRHFGHPLNQRSFDGNEHMRRTNGISSDPKTEVMDGWNKTHVHETALVSGGTRML